MDLFRKFLVRYDKAFWFILWVFSFFILRKIHELAALIALITLVVLGLVYSLYTTYRYRKGKLNYIVFNSYNDDYAGFEAFLFGILVMIGASLMLYFDYIAMPLFVVGLLVGTLLFSNYYYSMPSGFLKFKSGVLKLYGVTGAIEVENIKSIEIYANRIAVRGLNGKTWLASSIKIDEIKAEEIIEFLTNKLVGYPVEISSKVGDANKSPISHLNTHI